MPRYYCDYCDTYLTHDSPVVRKQHNSGYKHKANVRNYYMQFEEAQTQSLIDNKIMEFEARSRDAFQAQVAAAFQAQMTARSTGAAPPNIPRPILPTPPGALGGAAPPGVLPSMPQAAPQALPQGLGPPPAFRPPGMPGGPPPGMIPPPHMLQMFRPPMPLPLQQPRPTA